MIKKEGKKTILRRLEKDRRLEQNNRGSPVWIENMAPEYLQGSYRQWHQNSKGVAVDGEGNVYYTAKDNKLYRISADFEERETLTTGLPTDSGTLDYNHLEDTILWALNGEVREIDANTGEVLHSLSTPHGTGQAGHWSGKDTFLLAHPNNHYVNELNWAGDELWSYGTYGTSGASSDLLNTPKDVAMGLRGNRLIADKMNNRILNISDTTFNKGLIVNYPKTLSVTVNGGFLVASDPHQGGNMANPYSLIKTNWHGNFRSQYPLKAGDIACQPNSPYAWISGGAGTRRISHTRIFRADPQSFHPIVSESVGAGDTYTTPPFFLGDYTKIGLYSYGDQSHDITIEKKSQKEGLLVKSFPVTYRDLTTVSASANTLSENTFAVPLYLFRLRLKNTGSASGTFDVRVKLK